MVTQPSFTLSLREHTYCTWELVAKHQLSELNENTLEQKCGPPVNSSLDLFIFYFRLL